MAETVKVAAIQMACVLAKTDGDVAANLAHAADLANRAASCGARLIALPELFNTGYRVEERDRDLAEPIPGRTTDWMRELAARHDAYLVGALMEREGDLLYDTAALVGPEGLVARHRKMYLWGPESERWSPGDDVTLAPLALAGTTVQVGLQICYEIGFPEGARKLAQQGADILVYTAAFGRARGHVWDLASRARALENGVFVVGSNHCGQERDTPYCGLSRVVAPDTSILAGAGVEGEAVVLADLDLAATTAQRQAIPYLRDLAHRPFPHAKPRG